MAVDQTLWGESFSRYAVPPFRCPTCHQGTLGLNKEAMIEEATHSSAAHSHEAWEPDWVSERFTLFLKCSVSKCGEFVAVSGDTSVEQVEDEELGYVYESLLRPKSMFPAPRIIELPEGTPVEVVKEIDLAFQLFWSDRGACATKIRTSVERLMDHFGCAKYRRINKTASKPGKLLRLDLFSRIERFIISTGSVVHQDHLHALRVVGNLGTHESDISRADILSAFEVYEHALAELIGKKSKQIAKLAKKLKSK
jgi:hypothetical protein